MCHDRAISRRRNILRGRAPAVLLALAILLGVGATAALGWWASSRGGPSLGALPAVELTTPAPPPPARRPATPARPPARDDERQAPAPRPAPPAADPAPPPAPPGDDDDGGDDDGDDGDGDDDGGDDD